MQNRIRFTTDILAVLLTLTLTFLASSGSSQSSAQSSQATDPQNHSHDKGSVVYVCVCLKNKSNSCMTEAKMAGLCACGTEGGPPMKAVPSDSDWAKQNREALANS